MVSFTHIISLLTLTLTVSALPLVDNAPRAQTTSTDTLGNVGATGFTKEATTAPVTKDTIDKVGTPYSKRAEPTLTGVNGRERVGGYIPRAEVVIDRSGVTAVVGLGPTTTTYSLEAAETN